MIANKACTRKLKIAFLVPQFPTYSETFIYRKLDYLLAAGHDVDVYCRTWNRDFLAPAAWDNRINVLPSDFQFFSRPDRLVADIARAIMRGQLRVFPFLYGKRKRRYLPQLSRLSARAAIFARIAGTRYDLIHTHYIHGIDLLEGLRFACKCPVIASVYGFDISIKPHAPGGYDELQVRLGQIDALTYSSAFLRQTLHSLCDIDKPEIVLPPEVPTELFKARARESTNDPLRILTVGRLTWAKGYAFALPAIRRLVDAGIECEYRIVGAGNGLKELQYSIGRLDLTGRVKLVGALTPAEVADQMDWADLYLSPSQREDFGVVLVEAQASGLPVVATDVGGPSESTLPNETAILVPARDPGALADGILRVARDSELYRSMSRKGPQFAEQFSYRPIRETLVGFYYEIVERFAMKVPEKTTLKLGSRSGIFGQVDK